MSSLWIDCHDLDSALRSSADAIGVSEPELREALLGYDEPRFEGRDHPAWETLPQDTLEHFGTDVDSVLGRLAGVLYFHGSRALDADDFRSRGILPLPDVLPEIWAALRGLIRGEISDEVWTDFRASMETGAYSDDWNYRLKASKDPGPYGVSVREILLNPPPGTGDYLGCPEVVQSITRCCEREFGIDLEQRFCDAFIPCIVTFRSTENVAGVVRDALWYACSKLRRGELGAGTTDS